MAEEEKFEDLVFDPLQYEQMEKDCVETTDELRQIPALTTYLDEYGKLFKAMKKGHESEMRLVQRCKILQADRKRAVVKIQAAMNVAIEDSGTIETFQKERDTLKNTLNEAKRLLIETKEEIDRLTQEMEDKKKLLNIGPELAADYKRQLADMGSKKQQLLKDRDEIAKRVTDSRKEQTDLNDKNTRLHNENNTLSDEIDELERQYQEKRAEMEAAKLRKIRADEESKKLKKEIDELNDNTDKEKNEGQSIQQNLQMLSVNINQINQDIDKRTTEAGTLSDSRQKAEEDLKRERERVLHLRAENDGIVKEIADLHKQIIQTQITVGEQRRGRDRVVQQLRQTEAKRAEMEKERIAKREVLREAEEAHEQQERENKEAKGTIEMYEKKLQLLQKKVVSNAQEVKRKQEMKELALMEKRFMETHKANAKSDLEKLKKDIEQYLTEKNRYDEECLKAQQELQQMRRTLSQKAEIITQANGAVDEAEQRLRSQQNMLETVQTERNLGSRKLITAQDANTELQHRFMALEQEISQVKETIKTTDKQLLEENLRLDQMVASAKALRKKVVEYEAQLAVAEETVNAQKDQIKQLMQIISTSETQVHREREEYKHVMGERAVLDQQLIERDHELSGLYERMVLQQATLGKGESQYADITDKIDEAVQRVIVLRQQSAALRARVVLIKQLEREVLRLDSDVTNERLKIRGMEDEFVAPINAHRWRMLESIDPDCLEILSKIHALQKKLIVVTDELTEKNQLIQEKERLGIQLSELIHKQSGPELEKEIERMKSQLKEKEGSVKTINTELRIAREEGAGYEEQIDRLREELYMLKESYLESMKQATGLR